MNKSIRQTDIARVANVSQATVSLVLDGKADVGRVSAATRQRIGQVAREMGYLPNIVARQLRGSRSGLIGVLAGLGSAPVIFDRMLALERAALERGYRTLVGQFGGNLELADQYVSDFAARRVDGTICMTHEYRERPEAIARLVSRLHNVVYLRQPAVTDAHYIHVDAADCIHQAVGHLTGKGRKRIGLVILDDFYQANLHRRQGYAEAMKRHNLPLEEALVWVGDDRLLPNPHEVSNDKAAEVVQELVITRRADSIIAINDDWAAQLIKAIRRLGLSVPGDVSVVGQGNFKIASFFDPEITTLDPQNEVFAEAAMDMLAGLIEKGGADTLKSVTVKPKLIVRQSA